MCNHPHCHCKLFQSVSSLFEIQNVKLKSFSLEVVEIKLNPYEKVQDHEKN